MFFLSDIDLKKRFLGCGDGPASVNAELHELDGIHYVSLDPIYRFSGDETQSRVQEHMSKWWVRFCGIISQIPMRKAALAWQR